MSLVGHPVFSLQLFFTYAVMNHQKIHFPDVLEAWKVVTWTKGIYIMKSKKGLDF